ncbi:hypothetical protein D9756_006702 [Leucocoprinus leucothites]|uniref:Mandelate racemase/muconate lactonizing enzyme C-terminal domain-containing protein n=1 Tax=Leucocoprinus leucothites TaxID=201217 RepID=A0A8H5G1U0_9AGAR|nr:hypothetical protein D9756_006702 [Leucoagaricus leucothites]
MTLIQGLEVFRVPPRWVFVRVVTSDGLVGWGEATLEGHTEAIEGALQDLREKFTGWDSNNIEDIWQVAYRGRFYRGGPVLMSALSGLDIALWDIKGKRLGVPVWQLLGGKVRNRIKVYGWIGGDKPSDVIAAAQRRKHQGFMAVKMNGTESIGWIDSPAKLKDSVERVRDVRALEPLLPTQPEEIADLKNLVATPIALGERLYTRMDYRPYFERRAIDIAQPDIAHCGGISELHRIATLAEAYDVALAPHCPLGPIAFAACLQVATCTANFVIQEMSWEIHYNASLDSEVGADLHTFVANPEVFQVKDGHVGVLEAPGLGIEVNEELVRNMSAQYVKKYPAWRNPVWRGEDGTVVEW